MNTLTKEVRDMIIESLDLDDVKPEEITEELPLFVNYDDEGVGLELDSVDALELIVSIRENYDIEVTSEDMYIFQNLATIASFIEEKREQHTQASGL
jgi:acyl carrier protein